MDLVQIPKLGGGTSFFGSGPEGDVSLNAKVTWTHNLAACGVSLSVSVLLVLLFLLLLCPVLCCKLIESIAIGVAIDGSKSRWTVQLKNQLFNAVLTRQCQAVSKFKFKS